MANNEDSKPAEDAAQSPLKMQQQSPSGNSKASGRKSR
jgi:hypothetical protein